MGAGRVGVSLLRGAILGFLLFLGGCMQGEMPGISHTGKLPPPTEEEKLLAQRLHAHVTMLAGRIGERNMVRYDNLQQAAGYIVGCFRDSGYTVREKPYEVDGKQAANIEVELTGEEHPEQIVVIGAHYDSVTGSPGANDNASGVAALLELARRFKAVPLGRTVRFVAFVNEEPPYFQTGRMGSRVYAAAARKRGERIAAMLALETIGYYSDAAGSQHYPAPVGRYYPDTGNFIGFVSNQRSASLLHYCVKVFRETTPFPSEGLAAPELVQGVGWSDQWSFWQEGYPGIMITDTAPFRYPHYHLSSDLPQHLNYERMARVTAGIGVVIEGLLKSAAL